MDVATPTENAEPTVKDVVSAAHVVGKQYMARLLNVVNPFPLPRWFFTGFVFFMFMLRVLISGRWFLLMYGAGIYILGNFILFISPLHDPQVEKDEDEEENEGGALPTKSEDEFRPFVRRLPEFKFWIAVTRVTLIVFFLSMFRIFDIPVYWPILLVYFIGIAGLALRKEMRRMARYNYIPIVNIGKKKYGDQASNSEGSGISTHAILDAASEKAKQMKSFLQSLQQQHTHKKHKAEPAVTSHAPMQGFGANTVGMSAPSMQPAQPQAQSAPVYAEPPTQNYPPGVYPPPPSHRDD